MIFAFEVLTSKVFLFNSMKTITIALPLPVFVQKTLQRLCYGLPDALWTEENNFHIAMRTFRKVDGNTLLDIKESLSKMTMSPLSISLQGVESHWAKSKESNVWVNVIMTPSLEQLHKEIAKTLKDIKLEQEEIAQKPHIPLGKCKALSPQRLATYLEANAGFYLPSFEVNSLILLSSQTTDTNIIYRLEV